MPQPIPIDIAPVAGPPGQVLPDSAGQASGGPGQATPSSAGQPAQLPGQVLPDSPVTLNQGSNVTTTTIPVPTDTTLIRADVPPPFTSADVLGVTLKRLTGDQSLSLLFWGIEAGQLVAQLSSQALNVGDFELTVLVTQN